MISFHGKIGPQFFGIILLTNTQTSTSHNLFPQPHNMDNNSYKCKKNCSLSTSYNSEMTHRKRQK